MISQEESISMTQPCALTDESIMREKLQTSKKEFKLAEWKKHHIVSGRNIWGNNAFKNQYFAIQMRRGKSVNIRL